MLVGARQQEEEEQEQASEELNMDNYKQLLAWKKETLASHKKQD